MNIHLVIDGDTQKVQRFDFVEVEEIRWEAFHSMLERLFSEQDAYVGDSIFPALFLNSLTVRPDVMATLPDGRVYLSVRTI